MAAETDVTPIPVFFSGESSPDPKSRLRKCKRTTTSAEQLTDKTGNATQLPRSNVRGNSHSEAASKTNSLINADSPGIMLAYSGAKSQSGPLANGDSSVHPAPCIVLGLASNSPSSRLRNGNRSPCEIQEPTTKVSTKEKQQIPDIVEQDTTVRVASVMPRSSDRTKFPRHFLVLESTGVNGGMLSAKRKRGRRANKKKLRTVYILDEEQGEVASSDSDNPVGATHSSAQLPDHSVQSMGSAYEALMIELRKAPSVPKRHRKVRRMVDLIAASPEVQTPQQTIIKGALMSTETIDVETEQEGNMVNDVDRLLSTLYLEKSPPEVELTKSSLDINESENEEVVDREDDQLPDVDHHHHLMNQTTIMTSELCASTSGKENQIAETGTNHLPFVKNSPVWKIVESLPIFKQLPQNPHFNPLYDCKEQCREGLAIASMVTFARLAEMISKLQFGEPRTNLESIIEALLKLETEGFIIKAVRERLNSLLLIKDQHGCSLNHSKDLETQLSEQCKVKEKLVEEISQVDQKIAELREKREHVLLDSERKESEIETLRSDVASWKRSMEGAHSEFERVVSAPWL